MALKNLIGEVLDGKYRIEKELGVGGMGAVYLATHIGTERPVAVKVINPQFMRNEEFVERFRREARAAGRMRHPNVVDVTDFGFARVEADLVAYLVMEYLDGCALSEILEEETSLPLSWVIDILEQTCSAVDEAHKQGIIHRDLKPDNIWLEPNRRGGYTIKVLDFGIAKLDEPSTAISIEENNHQQDNPGRQRITSRPTELQTLVETLSDDHRTSAESEAATLIYSPAVSKPDLSEIGTQILAPKADNSEAGTLVFPIKSDEEDGTLILDGHTTDKRLLTQTNTSGSLTQVGSILGTPYYMSPEQFSGGHVDARTDIYSLGVIAYRLISGHVPFSGNLPTVMKMHREAEPPPLQVRRVPKKVAALVMSTLAKDPQKRPQSAAAFASALRAHATGAGSLIRHALTLYSEHLPTFLRLALIVYSPLALLTLVQVAIAFISMRKMIRPPWDSVASVAAGVVAIPVTFFCASILFGVTIWLVTQALAVPLRPLVLRPAFGAMKDRLWPFFKTTIAVNLLVLLGMILLVIPGFYLMANFALVAAVVMMEDLSGVKAMKRSRALYKRSRRTVIAIICVHVMVPFFVNLIAGLLIVAVVKALKPGELKPANNIVTMIQHVVSLPVTIIVSSIASVISALLYWKTRQAGGETLRDAISHFTREDASARRWQERMRTRLQTIARTNRSGSSS